MRQTMQKIALTAVIAVLASLSASAQVTPNVPSVSDRPMAGAGPRMMAHTLPAGQARMVGKVKILNVRDNVYMIEGAGANIGVLTFGEGITLVDAGTEAASGDVIAALKSITPESITYIIDTSSEPDHISGNAKLTETGHEITGGNVLGDDRSIAQSAEIIAYQTVLDRLTAVKPPLPFHALPETTYETPYLKLSTIFHGGAVELLHPASAITDGDTMVWFRNNDVILTGDVFDETGYPKIDVEKGGSINGEIDALNQVVDLAFPEFRMENGTLIVPGHGRLCDIADIAYYRDMVTIIRDRVQEMMKKGETLDQIKAAHVTKDYDPRYAGNYSSDMFVETVYKSLMKTAASPGVTTPAGKAAPAAAAGKKKS